MTRKLATRSMTGAAATVMVALGVFAPAASAGETTIGDFTGTWVHIREVPTDNGRHHGWGNIGDGFEYVCTYYGWAFGRNLDTQVIGYVHEDWVDHPGSWPCETNPWEPR